MGFTNRLGISLVGFGVALGCAGTAPDESASEIEQHIELHDRGATYGFAFAPSPPLQPGEALAALQARLMRHAVATQATGAILAPLLDASGVPSMRFGSAVRFTCGATMISPSYVVTAAHCVDSDSIRVPTDTVVLEMYRPTSHLALSTTWQPKTQLTGTFPDFQHGTYGAEDGYYVDHYTCTLSARCGSGSVNCPNSATAIDVALLHCDGRPGDRYGYLDIATSERAGVEVYVPWKHEVYDIAASEPTTSDKYLHYVQYPVSTGDNYHYLDRNQLLPLETIAWPDGSRPRKLSDPSQLTIWTDVVGCHGTSGSGFLQQNPATGAWELLGPTAVGGSAFGSLLCEHAPGISGQSTALPGQQNIGYSSVVQTQTVLSGATAAWGADCASEPLGFFSLGGRSGCTRAQRGLSFAPRAVYSDLDPWLSPSLQVGAATTQLGPVQLEAGKSYRVALGLTPAAGCTAACPDVMVRVGTTEVLRATLQASAGQTALLGAVFTAVSAGSQPVSLQTPAGSFELGKLEIVPNAGINSLDTSYERAEAALIVPASDASKPLPMRFVGDGAQGFAGLLYAGERLVLVREALALQGNFSVRFTSPSPAAMTCGLVGRDGSVLASASCLPGVSTALSYLGGVAPAAVFLEGAPASGVEIDNVAVSLDQLATSHCNNSLTDVDETDTDCGGSTCARCADNKNCVTPADCASNICTAGKCAAAPTCSDGLKNGSETDVDCGGSCSQHCAVGKACGVAADCTTNICTAGICRAAPTCSDGLKNGNETDIDCGGSCSQHCAVGKACGVANDCTTNICTAGICASTASAQAPFGGSARSATATIQAEDYDVGGEGVAYHDTTAGNASSGTQRGSDGVDIQATADSGGGLNVGWTAVGEWLEYTLNVATTGSYSLELRVAAIDPGKKLHVEINGVNVSGAITVPDTNAWQTYQTLNVPNVNLSAGSNQVVRLVFDTGGINLNWFRFNAASMCTPTTCAALGASCGTPSNGCGGSLSCGTCVAGQTCTASNQCQVVSSGSEPCTPSATLSTQTNSGNFGTTGPYCFRTSMNIAGWGCSNFNGRSLQVNDVALSCGAQLPAKYNGYYYFESTNGAFDYASIYWWQ